MDGEGVWMVVWREEVCDGCVEGIGVWREDVCGWLCGGRRCVVKGGRVDEYFSLGERMGGPSWMGVVGKRTFARLSLDIINLFRTGLGRSLGQLDRCVLALSTYQ